MKLLNWKSNKGEMDLFRSSILYRLYNICKSNVIRTRKFPQIQNQQRNISTCGNLSLYSCSDFPEYRATVKNDIMTFWRNAAWIPYNSNWTALFRMNEFNFRVNGTFV